MTRREEEEDEGERYFLDEQVVDPHTLAGWHLGEVNLT